MPTTSTTQDWLLITTDVDVCDEINNQWPFFSEKAASATAFVKSQYTNPSDTEIAQIIGLVIRDSSPENIVDVHRLCTHAGLDFQLVIEAVGRIVYDVHHGSSLPYASKEKFSCE